jgi:hypothetical protein
MALSVCTWQVNSKHPTDRPQHLISMRAVLTTQGGSTNLAPQVDGALEVENACEQGDRQRSLDTLRRLDMSYDSVR